MPTSRVETGLERRAQPWLGTFVEIRAENAGLSRWHVLSGIDAAFGEVARVHRLLSRQERGTDYVKLLAAARGEVVPVDIRTAEVLRLGMQLREQSAGLFDPERVDGRQLHDASRLEQAAWSFESDTTVRVLRRARPDLDGIAKGYAVDRAIGVLESRGIAATVNAGGDLRTTRRAGEILHLRCGGPAGGLVNLGLLGQGAFATSQSSVTAREQSALAGDGIQDRRHPDTRLPLMTVGAAAMSCALADALTKIVAVGLEMAVGLLEKYDAAAWVLREFEGSLRMIRLGPASIVAAAVT